MKNAKINFKLTVEDDWPPVAIESLNCIVISDKLVKITNTPFFAESVANGDIVRVSKDENTKSLIFEEVVEFSGSSAISIILIDIQLRNELCEYFESAGCMLEYGEICGYHILAVEIPKGIGLEKLVFYLHALEEQDKITFDVLCNA